MNTLNRKSMLLIVILFAVASLLLSGCDTDEDLVAAATPTEQAQISQVVRADTNGDGVVDTQYIVVGDKIVATSAITMAHVPVVNTPPAPPPANVPVLGSGGGEWTPASKCEWLRANFPQTTEKIQTYGAKLAGVEPKRIRPTTYDKCEGLDVFDGFIVLGTNDGFSGAVTLIVPQGGAIDAYARECGAAYEFDPALQADKAEVCDDTWRATRGWVQALSMTYWPWNDAAPPPFDGVAPAAATATPLATNTVAPANPTPNATQTALAQVPVIATSTTAPPTIVATAAATATPVVIVTAGPEEDCTHPKDIAAKMGWTDVEWADEKYGGRRVELKSASTLPLGWEGETSGHSISASDTDRSMVPGFWSVYPPRGKCRAQWGFLD